jgi:hypothetical protein
LYEGNRTYEERSSWHSGKFYDWWSEAKDISWMCRFDGDGLQRTLQGMCFGTGGYLVSALAVELNDAIFFGLLLARSFACSVFCADPVWRRKATISCPMMLNL